MKKELENLLLSKEEYTVEGKINKNRLAELARNYDSTLLSLLFSNEKIKNHFYTETDQNVVIFKKDVFLQFLNNKEFLPDSFTSYKTKIGLATSDNKYLTENNNVVINFPYKDCILEGGQTKADAKRQEIYFNETLAPTEISRLLDDKVFTNFKRYDSEGQHDPVEINNEDNLIIKGNNLIALHSLKRRIAGEVKLIYIDPPFNTNNDSFKYNDRFSRSTWLAFMKNRLSVSRQLLSEDGSIFIHVDENQSHYLKVLCDEIFGEDNFVNEIIWRYRTYVGQVKDYFPKKHDTIFWYKKNHRPMFNQLNVGNFEDTPDYKRWKNFLNEDGEIIFGNHPTTDTRFDAYLRKYTKQFGEPKNGDVIYQNKGYIVDDVWEDITALDAKNKSERISGFSGSGQKPEALLQRIIESVTNKDDLVIDFHMGSATTLAVAMKMKRRFIGIEQMDYISSVSVPRLQNVINGEQGGISQDVNWQGGGSFVYCELKNDAQDFKEKIAKAESSSELLELFNFAKQSSFLSYRVNPKKLKEKEFLELSLAEQKQILDELIDNNNLYVNYSDIDDKTYEISELDKKLNYEFYGGE